MKIFFKAFLLPSLLLLSACGGKEKSEPAAGAATPAANAPSGAAPAPPAASREWRERVKVKGADDATVFDIKMADIIKVEIGAEGSGNVLRGEMRPNGKRKYEMEGGMVLAEVKSDDDAIKVRTPDGKLLWKIKLGDGSVKISNNDQNENAYRIKLDGDRVKVEDGAEAELGKATYQADRGRVKVKDAADSELFQIDATRISLAHGVLLLTAIPQTERAIIMAELLARGL
jgi:hypothetical protein